MRNEKRDAEQRTARNKLEEREAAARSEVQDLAEAKRQFNAQVVRLRAENEARLQAEQSRVRAEVQAEREAAVAGLDPRTGLPATYELKVKWKTEKAQVEEATRVQAELERLFGKYGQANIVLSKKAGRALVAFDTREAAQMAAQLETGSTTLPLSKVEWAQGDQAAAGEVDEVVLEATTLSDQGFDVYETSVLNKLRRVQAERGATAVS
jgi:hypothetical protein